MNSTVEGALRLPWGNFPSSTNQRTNDKDSSLKSPLALLWLPKFLFSPHLGPSTIIQEIHRVCTPETTFD